MSPAAGTPVSGQQTSSGSYTATWNANDTVTVKNSGSTVFTVSGTVGGFDSSQKAFVAETLNGSTTSVDVYNLSSATPQTSVFHTGATVTSDHLAFSPSGHDVLYAWTTSDGATHLQLGDATAVTSQSALWSSQVTSVSPPDTGAVTVGTIGTVRYGWGPDDSRFLYGATAANAEASWYWTDVSAAPPATRSDQNIVATSSYVAYSPCGNGLAVVNSSGTNTVTVNLFDSSTGAAMGPQASGQTSSPVVLKATTTEYVATIGTTDHDLAANTCTTSTGGGGGGGSGGQTGTFVKPAAGSVVSGQQASSGQYTATWSGGTVSVSKAGNPVLTTQGTVGGFGPGAHAFVAESMTGGITSVRLFDLDASAPGTAVWNGGTAVTSDELVFSPKGHYLLYAYTTAGGGSAQVHFEAADAKATSNQPSVWTAGAFTPGGVPTGADGSGEFGAATYGFGPDDTTFVYGYVSGTTVTWDWANLATVPPAATYSQPNVSASSSYAEFCPCGDSLAFVDGQSDGSVAVDLFASSSQTALGSASGQADGPVTLTANTTSFVATFGGADHTLAPNTCTSSGGGGDGGGDGDGTPVAAFTPPPTALTGIGLSFTDTSTDAGGTIAGWTWDFGDGATSSEQNPTHTYAQPATYTVTLTVTDAGPAATTDTTSTQLVVTQDQPPHASFSYSPDPIERGDTVTFTDTSTDDDGIVNPSWGWTDDDGGESGIAGSTFTHKVCGPATVYLDVEDHAGHSADASLDVGSDQSRTIDVPTGGSLVDAVDHACPGDTVQLASGTYQGGVSLEGVNLIGQGAGVTIVTGGCDDSCEGGEDWGTVLAANPIGGQDTEISKLSVRDGAAGVEVATDERGSGQSVTLDSVEVDHNSTYGVTGTTPYADFTVQDSSVHDTQGLGIGMECCSVLKVLNSEVYDNSGGGTGAGETGGFVFTGNYVHDNATFGLYANGLGGVITNNRFVDNSGVAAQIAGIGVDQPVLFGGNLVAHNGGGGVDYSGVVDVVNNTIVDNTGTGLFDDQQVDAESQGLSFDYPPQLWFDNNILSGNTTDMFTGTVFCTATDDIVGDAPAFADDQYHLAPGSAAIDAGSNAAVPAELSQDAAGDARISDGDGDGTATVDVGWDETAGSGGSGGTADTPPGPCDPRLRVDAYGPTDPGGTLSTDAGDAPSSEAPMQTSVTVPTALTDSSWAEIHEYNVPSLSLAALSGWRVVIANLFPASSAAAPFGVTFSLDSSLVGLSDPAEVVVSLGGTVVPDCTDESGTAAPDPCVATRSMLDSGGVTLTVISSDPSGDWTFTSPAPTSVSVAADPTTAVAGEPVTYTATVTPAPDGGTVAFADAESGEAVPGCAETPVAPATGTATCTVDYPAVGPMTVTASYSGDDHFAPSGPSDPVVVTPTPGGGGQSAQTITFAQPDHLTYGGPDQALAATATSNLPVAFITSSPSVCTVADGMLHATGAGSCVVTASQPGDGTFAAAPDAPVTVEIDRAPLTITAGDATMPFGGPPPTVSPVYAGFVGSDNAASLTTVPTCTADTTAGTTSCTGAASANYVMAYVPGILTVVPVAAGAPTGVVALPGQDGGATVSFTAPASNGGSPVVGYVITPSPACATCTGLATSAGTTPVTSMPVAGLTDGTAYTFQVAAVTTAGTGAWSAASAPVTPTDAPSGVVSTTTTDANTAASASTAGITAVASGGTGTVNVSRYPSDPAAPLPDGSGGYVDVSIAAGSSFTKVVVTDCDLHGGAGPDGTLLHWWDPVANAWEPVSPAATLSAGPPACLTVTVTGTSSPSLAQLSGTIFGAALAPAILPPPTPPLFTATGPTRVLDTRSGRGAPKAPVGAGKAITLTVPSLPAGTIAVVLNLTATQLAGAPDTYVSACPAAQPLAACTATSAINAVTGVDVANEVTVPVAPDGKITFYNNAGSIDLVGDLVGYEAGGYTTTGPTRVLDTRTGTGAQPAKVGPKGTITLAVPNVPAGTTAVVLNLAATQLTGAQTTYLSACPAAQALPACTATSALNAIAGVDRANEISVPVGPDGKITFYNNAGSIDLVADLVGYQTGGYAATGPTRVLDSRIGTGVSKGPVGPTGSITLTVPNLPAGTTAVVLNLAATQLTGAASTYVSACPAAQSLPACTATSALNAVPDVDIANEVTVPVAPDGKITLYNNAGSIDLVADLVGYQVG